MVEAGRISVRHDQAVKCHGQARLAEGLDFSGFAKNFGSRRNQEVLAVVGIDVVGEQAFDRPGELSVEPVEENGFQYGSFKQHIGFSPLPPRRNAFGGGLRGVLLSSPFDDSCIRE